ncbi:MAG: DNA repair protein RecO C-terminal domain-containing protein, partial [Eubacteriales bacterium]|nr:DNA repair protein RecO C-terminal domain-containing protein [Eubacteriales bacterium]
LHYLAGADCKSDDPSGEGRTPELLCAVFELRALAILGFGPETQVCAECGAEPGTCDDFLFSFEKCGLVCGSCRENDVSAISISNDAALAIRHIVQSDDGGLFAFRLKGKPLRELGVITRRYLRERLGHDFIKPDFVRLISF